MSEVIEVAGMIFEVRRSHRRKTLQITIDRDSELLIAAPFETSTATLTDFVRDKQFWIFSKLAEKAALQQPVTRKEFVTGEGFSYLGRSYRLLLVDELAVPLKLEAGRFKLRRDLADTGRAQFVRWYTERGRAWLRRRVVSWASRMQVEPTGIEVRDLGYRWGSCGQAGGVNFHWATILLPAAVVDYVIVHELAHLKEPNHTPEFWLRVARALPDFEQRKAWLAEHGGRAASL